MKSWELKERVSRRRIELTVLNSLERSEKNPLDLAIKVVINCEKQCQWEDVDASLIVVDNMVKWVHKGNYCINEA